MINVTKSFVPPMDEYASILQRAFSLGWLTNRGVLVRELEDNLKKFLNVPYLTLTTNGTLPIQIAIKTLKLKGEIITTPFSYVATSASIVWENCKPVFVDIEPNYLTIDPKLIEEKITKQTTAILATHVYGNPCDVDLIGQIAKKYHLKVIYDAAHCFGVQYKGQSIFNYGDVSTCSFHATKIFHTGEGGCWVTQSKELQDKLFYHHNFGHDGPENFYGLGINAKMSELQAAMGLAIFNHLDEIFENRKKAVNYYMELLKNKSVETLTIRPDTEWNYHYFPVIFDSEETLLSVVKEMNQAEIYPRRYFYPPLNHLPYVDQQDCPVSDDISKRVLCLPLYSGLEEQTINSIVDFIN